MNSFSLYAPKPTRPLHAPLGQAWKSLAALGLSLAAAAYSQTADSFNPAVDGPIVTLAVQPDAKILVGGSFSSLAGQSRTNIGRFNPDGSTDTGFNPGADGVVSAFLVQPDGKILVGGSFTSIASQVSANLARLNADGSLDTSITPTANSNVLCLALQSDGKTLVGGGFTTLVGLPRSRLARLNINGLVDGTFTTSASDTVRSLLVLADGSMLVGGDFTTLGGQTINHLGHVLPNGNVDTNFSANIAGNSATVNALALQADGKILVGGSFTNLVAGQCLNLGRLNANFTLDPTFNPSPDNSVNALAVQTDGKILLGGTFKTIGGGRAAVSLGRLNADGSADLTFSAPADNPVMALALQTDGKVLVGGSFAGLANQLRSSIGRLNNSPATQSITFNGSTVNWSRGGSSPEVWRTTFEISTNGLGWINLGPGTRATNGWQLSGLSFSTNFPIRARGFVAEGADNGSCTVVQTLFGTAPVITVQPVSQTNTLGAQVVFAVQATGSQPLAYQWRKGSAPLADGAKYSGSKSNTLTVNSLVAGDAGAFSVIITNQLGSTTSITAALTVSDPAILTQPVGRTNYANTLATFTVVAAGTPPLAYQWRKGNVLLTDNANVSGSQTPTLTLNAVFGADAGAYSVIVSNATRSITSAVANLSVIDPYILAQPASQTADIGQTVALSVLTVGTAPMSYQWHKNGTNLPGANSASLVLTNVQHPDTAAYDVAVSNAFGGVNSTVANFAVNLATADILSPAADAFVSGTAEQKDGKILVGGAFTNLAGQARSSIARLNADGTLDTSFNPGASAQANAFVVQPDGKILVGGAFTNLAGQARNYLGRLNADGTLDTTFTNGADATVTALAVQADGKLLVGGQFSILAGQSRSRLARLNADGTLDAAFNPGANNTVTSFAVQPDGKIIIAGAFTGLTGHTNWNIARLNSDGTIDSSFSPVPNSWVYSLALQPDGKILLGGIFTSIGGRTTGCLARLNTNGVVDTNFIAAPNEAVYAVMVQADGKIQLGGNFTLLAGQPCRYFGRLYPDGSMDTEFTPNPNGTVFSLTLQADGKTVIGGNFSILNNQSRLYLGRVNASDPAFQNLAFDSSSITWLRGSTCPEVWLTTFDFSTDTGSSWTGLGNGTRIPGGWQLTGLSLPTNAMVRARGFVPDAGVSSWFVEQTFPVISQTPPTILTADGNFGFRTNQFGFNISGSAGQSIVVEASTNLIQWTPLTTNTILTSVPYFFGDPAAVGIPTRFYRVRLIIP